MDKEIQLSVRLITVQDHYNNDKYNYCENEVGTLYYIPNSNLPFTFKNIQSSPIEHITETKEELLIKTIHTKYTFEKL